MLPNTASVIRRHDAVNARVGTSASYVNQSEHLVIVRQPVTAVLKKVSCWERQLVKVFHIRVSPCKLDARMIFVEKPINLELASIP